MLESEDDQGESDIGGWMRIGLGKAKSLAELEWNKAPPPRSRGISHGISGGDQFQRRTEIDRVACGFGQQPGDSFVIEQELGHEVIADTLSSLIPRGVHQPVGHGADAVIRWPLRKVDLPHGVLDL